MPITDPEARRAYAREWMARRRAEWFAGKVCAICGAADELELDHKDRATKITHNIWSWRQDRREQELSKCQPLCKQCHKNKTKQENIRGHGTSARYNQGCRCEPCVAHIRERKRAWRERTGRH